MERVWQWVWDRYGPRYSWAVSAVTCVTLIPIYLACALFIVTFEDSHRYLAACTIAVVGALIALYIAALPGWSQWRLLEGAATGEPFDRAEVLASSYAVARSLVVRCVVGMSVTGAVLGAVEGALVGASTGRIVQWSVLGGLAMFSVQLIPVHSFIEAFLRPARLAIIGGTDLGDALPRARPTFATWASIAILSTVWIFTLVGALVGAIVDQAHEQPILAPVVATAALLVFGIPITLLSTFVPSLRPIRDLAEGTARVAAGDYTTPLPVVQDDDLGALAGSFNRMQAGLAERQRLQAAFGSYVDPALASRLLEQGDEVFGGEHREVTVMFVDVRDFTPFAEAHSADEAVAHLNALFEIIVPVVRDAGGHVNKYLGDGALAVFGAPNSLAAHADAAVGAAVAIQRLVWERFEGALRIGIGINTGEVIAGTIGGGGKLEFTLIGDTVNVAARVEQLTKATGDDVLLTEHTATALAEVPPGLADRGSHELKGKAAPTRVLALAAR
jgi:class 3 adenylate cyclase